ncbi:Uncharacterised protein [Vibrio cholerae]|uniref:Uncharacterized protein n=1 Tax=Vibrio cholerae TaxID=666 RepID=A0A060KYN3_VIBCL|nr:hypothetical protein [Vibrio cholerae]AIC64176.1 hypothetical protein [Vibrio cholerae]AIC64204.1 hypothetical protein [Vibrio cholerae]CSI82910.1 Uncharacterised protein [Vibrio cholerae]
MFFDFPLTLTINLEASSIDSKVLNRFVLKLTLTSLARRLIQL